MKNHACLRITLFTFILLFSGISHYASAKQKFRANTSGDGFPFYTKLFTGTDGNNDCVTDTTNVAAGTCDPGQVGVTLQLFTNEFGCDSLVITSTMLLPADTTNVAATTCDPGQVGITLQLFTNEFGCDSLVFTTTSLLPSDT